MNHDDISLVSRTFGTQCSAHCYKSHCSVASFIGSELQHNSQETVSQVLAEAAGGGIRTSSHISSSTDPTHRWRSVTCTTVAVVVAALHWQEMKAWSS